ncbi:MAG TPA: acetoin utilization protein AcuB [Gammaproteobacteria bacterium]|nr:acetoin utilization protein AcuB [Gammaproteobacteria bacterium]
MKTAAEVMTANPVCLYVEDPLEEAWQLMRKRSIRHIPITKKDGTLVGLVTHRNLLVNAQYTSQLTLPVAEIMDTNLITVQDDENLIDVALKLYDRKVGCLPVPHGEDLVGIITSGDFVALAKKLLEESEG